MIISYITLLLIDNPHAIPVDIGIAIKPIPVRLTVIRLDVVAKSSNVSNDLLIQILFYNFYIPFWFFFIFEMFYHFFNVGDRVNKTNYIFFCNLCSKSFFSNGAEGNNLSHFCPSI